MWVLLGAIGQEVRGHPGCNGGDTAGLLFIWMKGTCWHGGDALAPARFRQVTPSLLLAQGHLSVETPLPEPSPAAEVGTEVV